MFLIKKNFSIYSNKFLNIFCHPTLLKSSLYFLVKLHYLELAINDSVASDRTVTINGPAQVETEKKR